MRMQRHLGHHFAPVRCTGEVISLFSSLVAEAAYVACSPHCQSRCYFTSTHFHSYYGFNGKSMHFIKASFACNIQRRSPQRIHRSKSWIYAYASIHSRKPCKTPLSTHFHSKVLDEESNKDEREKRNEGKLHLHVRSIIRVHRRVSHTRMGRSSVSVHMHLGRSDSRVAALQHRGGCGVDHAD
ncbi:hypothetical protein BU23DRAFT_92984 [Bimuria novae-zelandiae CBS 107.79]|uniref:Uncharacterized protein n=1 Tax=Bimuria novae-zelandiae CBS 107.79 TaxID=1447943 RepID=A0A6A5VCT0_9PLEO|nr:hypothetical protein BU23DRAFT_92984 [Bimuria novae-zelandiae CBS 107.79]